MKRVGETFLNLRYTQKLVHAYIHDLATKTPFTRNIRMTNELNEIKIKGFIQFYIFQVSEYMNYSFGLFEIALWDIVHSGVRV